MYVYIADVLPYMKIDSYPFKYASYKAETEYIGRSMRFPLIDSRLSENKISLMGSNKLANLVKVVYSKYDDDKLNPIPVSVELFRVKNLKVYYTSYSKIHNNIVDVNIYDNLIKDEGFNHDNIFINRIISNNFKLKNNINLDKIFENQFVVGNDRPKLIIQLKLFHRAYKLLGVSLHCYNKITTEFFPEKIKHNFFENWIHNLIEITALEVNKYIAMIQVVGRRLTTEIINDLIRRNYLCTINENCPNVGFFRGENLSEMVYESEEFKTYFDGTVRNFNHINPENDINQLLILFYFIKYYKTYHRKTLNRDTSSKATNTTNPRFHFSTSAIMYTHFSSPLRRFIDICVHSKLWYINSDYLFNKYKEYFDNSYIDEHPIFNKKFKFYNKKLELIMTFKTKLNFVFSAIYNHNFERDRWSYLNVPLFDIDIPHIMNEENHGKYFKVDFRVNNLSFDIISLMPCDEDTFLETIYKQYGNINTEYKNTPYEREYLRTHLIPSDNILVPVWSKQWTRFGKTQREERRQQQVAGEASQLSASGGSLSGNTAINLKYLSYLK